MKISEEIYIPILMLVPYLLILSSKENYDGENIKTFLNTNDVLRYCKDKNYDEVWIIGMVKLDNIII